MFQTFIRIFSVPQNVEIGPLRTKAAQCNLMRETIFTNLVDCPHFVENNT
jgi:hypothetical protein